MENYSRQRIRIKTRGGWYYGKFLKIDEDQIIHFIDSDGTLAMMNFEGLHVEKEEVGPRGGKQWKSLGIEVTS